MSHILARSLLSPCLVSNFITENNSTELKSTLLHINDMMSRTYTDEEVQRQRSLLSRCGISTDNSYNRVIRDAQQPVAHTSHKHSELPICQLDELSDEEHMLYDDYKVVMSEGDAKAPSKPAGHVFDSIGTIRTFFKEKLNIGQMFGCAANINAIIHFGTNYANAFWDSQAIFFGDGDGKTFGPFYNDIDIIAHELAHGYISSEANFNYIFQSGALNESVADVIGIMVKQFVNNESASTSNWLLGENLFIDKVKAPALRSMSKPGSAYYFSKYNKDPQVAHMKEYKELSQTIDNGGVHINSGIPNRAFYLLATELGGNTWDVAGKIWIAAVSDPKITSKSNFKQFATATVNNARKLFGEKVALQTQKSWEDVGLVLDKS
ncbi:MULTISPECIES: M4 family metallopeptidase [Providencia]|jgi:Zn-dependent metalloprotease|uniref:M4 family metallopeptidase n=1 Tax=Providencia TaxID=586 RepID=UPI00235FB41C|nr:M4 family metallopeptidase [Providencia rettgeri]ELR5149439.1 M4 family metallopeptidase [Providencia rettgeri]MDR2226361.1 M4 family metallopeptidase [Providencia sp.]